MIQIEIHPKTLHFKQPAGTSRGVYTTRKVWYIVLTDPMNPHHFGVGECAPLPALSCDDVPEYADVLEETRRRLEENAESFQKNVGVFLKDLEAYPSIRFGVETALAHYQARSLQFWHTPFSKGKEGIPINGLIWMGNFDEMYQRIEEKMKAGFRCIKLKIGAIDFEKELDDRFFRAGRAMIVNLTHIRRVTKTEVHLSDGTVLPLPRGAYEPLNRAIIAHT